jgi:rod shape-determining protein MreD
VTVSTGGFWALPLRLALLAVAAVVIQIGFLSQITIFGVQPDIGPLVVMSVGLLCGALPGAGLGFWMGLLIDTALLQTLGIDSLLYIVVGYGAGRFRELRDPETALVPLGVGAAATAATVVGFSVIEFLLGIDAPVSWLLLREIVVTVIVGTLLALPVYAVVRRVLIGSLPDDPRRRRRRAYTTGGLSPLTRLR